MTTKTGDGPQTGQRREPGSVPIAVCKLDDIPRLGARRYRAADGRVIAIFRTAEDEVFALHDRCPHKGGPLSQGIVFGKSVACPLHNLCIGLESGRAAPPDEGVVERFDVRVVEGVVELDAGSEGRPRADVDPVPAWVPACAGTTKAC